MKKLLVSMLLAAASVHPAWAAKIAVFGDNAIDDFLTASGNDVTLVTNVQLEAAGFLDPFDLFIYTRNGNTFGQSLSATAAANVSAFVKGSIALFTFDLADTGFPGGAPNTLLTNAVTFASNKGFIGELSGACAAMTSNGLGLTPLSLIAGSCADIGEGPGESPMVILDSTSPLVTGLTSPVAMESGIFEAFADLQGLDPSLIVARNTFYDDDGNPTDSGIPAIVGLEREEQSIDEPASLMLLGLGLAAALAASRTRRVVRI